MSKDQYKLPPYKVEHVISTLSQTQCWSIKNTNIPNTWTVTEGEGQVAMVIDTGWTDHSDIGDNAIKGINTIGTDIVDRQGHQSHCVGIICAKNNDYGVVGVAPKAKVICVKALDDDGSGSNTSVANALEYAIKMKPSVVSMSLGSPYPSQEIHEKIKKLYEMNIPVVCAAGNDGKRGVDYPGAFPETIAVAAFDKNGNIATFSGVGPQVDFSAPGVDVYSTFLNNTYCKMSGTSMATPWITGLILLLLAKHSKQEKETGKNDCKTIEQIKEHLKKYTIDKGIIGKDNNWGYGVIDVEKLILSPCSEEIPVVVIPPIVKTPWYIRIWNRIKNLF